MTPEEADRALQAGLRFGGFMCAVTLVIRRHGASALARDLIDIDRPDAPPYLTSPDLPEGMLAQLADLRRLLGMQMAKDHPALAAQAAVPAGADTTNIVPLRTPFA